MQEETPITNPATSSTTDQNLKDEQIRELLEDGEDTMKTTDELTDNLVIAIFRNIANEADPHGHFLSNFAKAMVYARLENQRLLMPAAKQLVIKYNLEDDQRQRGILKPSQYDGPSEEEQLHALALRAEHSGETLTDLEKLVKWLGPILDDMLVIDAAKLMSLKECPQCHRSNSIESWTKNKGKCPNCDDLYDRENGNVLPKGYNQ